MFVRWLHVITAIAWIGSSFYFIWLDLSLRRAQTLPEGVKGESWLVHGGGFYRVQKYMVAPSAMPETLHWFKYESYFTWISGFLLLAVSYYWSAEAYLLDPAVSGLSASAAILVSGASLALGWLVYHGLCKSPLGRRTGLLAIAVYGFVVASAWGYSEVFSSRAALLHTGALVATWMTANVFFVIIPNQKRVVNALQADEAPDPALGLEAKQRSTHNNYLTLPVLFMMLSNHYPMTFVGEWLWLLAGVIVLLGGVIRDYFNATHSGYSGLRVQWQWPAALVLILGLGIALRPAPVGGERVTPASVSVSDDVVRTIVEKHCVSCHAAEPSMPGYAQPPQGVRLETLDDIRRYSSQVHAQSVASHAMPLGNMTGMTGDERQALAAWLAEQ
ncbi:cysteine desulfurase [Spiribacter aquaticus]|uniref:Cysteine desulfurase n=2 Tax=Ectothiorhodospiraceae TaxID=72276 RepID=A0A557RNK2_9GAMM|nr:cysteine desulfurase [Spiribacter roseus]TVO66751.1 cysteine desulfurase [Spiribacter aquaticus]